MLLKGNPVSGGIAIGKVYLYKAFSCDVHEAYYEKGEKTQKLAEWESAKEAARAELTAIADSFTRDGAADKAKIFTAHIDMLSDEEIDEMVREGIENDCAMPDYAVDKTFAEFIRIMGKVKNPLIAARAADLRDIRNRLIRILHGEPERNLSLLSEQVIVVAHDLLPSDTATIDRSRVIGIITEVGGPTSHSAIIARSYGIPAVLGVLDATKVLCDGALAILDAVEGTVRICPDGETVAAFQAKKAEYDRIQAETAAFLTAESLTKDGVKIDIGINIGSDQNVEYENCDFVGLFRTEFLFMQNDHLPTEEEQFEAYKRVLEKAGGKPVTLRTLDIGGDKSLPYLELPKEENPFLGKRAIRLCFDLPELFETQIRAALRASVFGKLWIMLPMIGGMEDIRRAKETVVKVKAELDARQIPYDKDVRLGIMIEIPSVALIADLAAGEVDFASLGTNDLCQYTCAADRMNPGVSEYCRSLSPAMLRIMGMAASAFNQAGKPISVCGELGGNPDAAVLLVGLGIRKLSMSASCIAGVKRRLSQITIDQAQKAAAQAVNLPTQEEVLRCASEVGGRN